MNGNVNCISFVLYSLTTLSIWLSAICMLFAVRRALHSQIIRWLKFSTTHGERGGESGYKRRCSLWIRRKMSHIHIGKYLASNNSSSSYELIVSIQCHRIGIWFRSTSSELSVVEEWRVCTVSIMGKEKKTTNHQVIVAVYVAKVDDCLIFPHLLRIKSRTTSRKLHSNHSKQLLHSIIGIA